jgi:hypothetical protein
MSIDAISSHVTDIQASAFIAGGLDHASVTAIMYHMFECDTCTNVLLDLHLASWAPEQARLEATLVHPSEEEIRAYARQQMDEAGYLRMEAHFEDCDTCHLEHIAYRKQS